MSSNINPHFTPKQREEQQNYPIPKDSHTVGYGDETSLNKQVGGEHYKLPIQPIEYIVKNNIGYREGNVIKYVSRHKLKGTGKEDLNKAIHYLEMILEDYNV